MIQVWWNSLIVRQVRKLSGPIKAAFGKNGMLSNLSYFRLSGAEMECGDGVRPAILRLRTPSRQVGSEREFEK